MTTVIAIVSKRHNSVWHGKGKVVSLDLTTGIAILQMTTGLHKGELGGFDLGGLQFRTQRVQPEGVRRHADDMIEDFNHTGEMQS